jgi:hypothetical protein
MKLDGDGRRRWIKMKLKKGRRGMKLDGREGYLLFVYKKAR